MKKLSWTNYVEQLFRFRFVLMLFMPVLLTLSLISAGNIRITSRIQDMLPRNNPLVRNYDRVSSTFSSSSVLVTFENEDPERMLAAGELLAEKIMTDSSLINDIRAVNVSVNHDFLLENALLLAEKDDLEDFKKILDNPNLLNIITSYNDVLEESWLDEGGKEVSSPSDESDMIGLFSSFEKLVTEITLFLNGSQTDAEMTAEKMSDALLFGDQAIYSPEYDMMILEISPSFDLSERKRLTRVIESIRSHTQSLNTEFPNLKTGISGDMAQEADEEKALSFDALVPALISLVLITLLFYFSFPDLSSLLFALAALASGIILDLGIIGLTIRELNMITSSFGVLLVGLGIDFGIHLISRFNDETLNDSNRVKALGKTLQAVGIPIAAGGLTTALAFYSLCISKTRGFAQFGFVAGTGIILVLLMMFTFLPVLLLLNKQKKPGKNNRGSLSFNFLEKLGFFMAGNPVKKIIPAALIITALSLFLLPNLKYSFDMRLVGPQKTESKLTEKRITEAFSLTPFPSFLMVEDLEEAHNMTEVFREHRLVSSVMSPSDFLPLPENQKESLSVLKEWHKNLKPAELILFNDSNRLLLAEEIQRLEWNIIEIADISAAGIGPENRIIEKRDAMIREIMGSETGRAGRESFQNLIKILSNPECRSKLQSLNQTFAELMQERIKKLTDKSYPLTIHDLPENIQRGQISRDSESGNTQFLLTVYPTESAAEEKGMILFDEKMSAIDGRITGTIPLSLVLSREILKETRSAAFLVLAIIMILLLITLGRIRDSLLAIGSLVLSTIWMMGFFTLYGNLNIINILCIPLIIGIGIDYSIHMIHALKTGTSLTEVYSYTGKSILLSALTTMTGFGSLAALGTFKGIASLGALLFLGTGTALVISFFVLPLTFKFLNSAKQKENHHV